MMSNVFEPPKIGLGKHNMDLKSVESEKKAFSKKTLAITQFMPAIELGKDYK